MQAVILVGGEGTRLRPLTSTVPKPIVPLVDRPFLAYMLEWLKRHGIDDIVLAMGYLPTAVRNVLGDGDAYGVRLRYVEEPDPRGTAGALKFAEDMLDERFLMLNGDVLTDIDVTARSNGDIVQIWVDDRGPGVPHAMRERVFHRGARAVPDQQEAGRGLGLFIARSLMRDEGGDLWVETRPGGGARFIVGLPVGAQDATLVDESARATRITPRPALAPRPEGERRSVRSS